MKRLFTWLMLLLLLGGCGGETAVGPEPAAEVQPAPTATAAPTPAFQGTRLAPGRMVHMPTTDPYCWQLWMERARAHRAICGDRPCPERRPQGCTVAWWVGSCRASVISCELGPE